MVVGREDELAVLADFPERVRLGPVSLLLEGDAGVGKTTLWLAGCDAARAAGARVLVARPVEAETGFAFGATADVLGDVHETIDALPEPQAHALRVALLLEPAGDRPADERAVGHGLVGILRRLSADSPVVVAVDDVQWLDAPSARVLAFAARRLVGEPVGFLLALRVERDSRLAFDPDRVLPALTRLTIGALPLEALHRLLEGRLGLVLPPATLREVHATSGGNPLFALELARALARAGEPHARGEPLPVPTSLRELVGARVTELPEATRAALLAAAALADPTLTVVSVACGSDAAGALEPAVAAEVVELADGMVRFTHPLLGAAVYDTAGAARRREMHAALAGLVGKQEARARHLALAAAEPDEAVASELEAAALAASARGAPVVAAELAGRAARLTPADREWDARRRLSDAAFWSFAAGDSRHARAILERTLEQAEAGSERALTLVRLARVRAYDDDIAAARELFRAAIGEARNDPELEAEAHEGVAGTSFRLREQLADAVEHAAEAARLAERAGRRDLIGEALGSQAVTEAILGRKAAVTTLQAALAVQPECERLPITRQPAFPGAVVAFWHDDLDGARATFRALLARGEELGYESSVPYLRVMLSQVECVAGRLAEALQHAEEEVEHARQAGQETLVAYLLAVAAWAHAHGGDAQAGRAAAARALELAERTSGVPAWFFATSALGHLELSLGDAVAADARLSDLVGFIREQELNEPGATWCVADHAEALVELARTDDALELLDWYEGNALRLGRVSAQANALRCRGRLAAAAGDLDGAMTAFAGALELHAAMPRPLDEGRTLLALGAAQRRAKQRRAARETLDRARQLFEASGARLWADRARAELARIGGRAAATGELTPVERRVATLVAAGRSNKEVAAALFLSPRTVEGHLSHVYGKLGVRSRVELARRLSKIA